MNKNVILQSSYHNQTGFPSDYKCLHSHPFDEISLIIRGDIKYISDNVTDRIDGRSLIFSRAYQLHNPYVNQSKPYERYQILFHHSALSDELIQNASIESFILPVSGDDFDELLGYMKSINRDYNANTSNDIALYKQKYLLSTLYAKIAHMYNNSHHTPQKITKSYIASVMEYINENCRQKLIIEDIAAQFFVSRTKLIKDFSARTGMTVLQYITLARIKQAKKYLQQGYSVTHTAELCGFSNSGHFIKVFSELNGITPLKFRQKI